MFAKTQHGLHRKNQIYVQQLLQNKNAQIILYFTCVFGTDLETLIDWILNGFREG